MLFPFKFDIERVVVGVGFVAHLHISRIKVAVVEHIVDAHPNAVGQIGVSGSHPQLHEGIVAIFLQASVGIGVGRVVDIATQNDVAPNLACHGVDDGYLLGACLKGIEKLAR